MLLKDCGIRIQVDDKPREAFVQICCIQDRHAADVLPELIRASTARQSQGLADLFAAPKRRKK
ncbi:plasmid-related protein [Paracandidimonas lactea]|uniref:plasmid-related protein n=1 Tax=Paracandidimonas lactea TaxID=2895524 RepID=UPI001F205D95|nr:plasmid-related protein [Paracandidimonas lactea]